MVEPEVKQDLKSVSKNKTSQKKITCEWCMSKGHQIQRCTRGLKKKKDVEDEIKKHKIN